jgi:hypothetical protein
MINLKKHDNVADAVQEVLEGKLHPNQQKLDVHEPEKDELTADDFKKLRAKKDEVKKEEVKDEYARKVDKYLKKKHNKEEVEQIDELSTGTLNSYVNKARNQVRASPGAQPNSDHLPTDPKIANRARGAVKADNRLNGFGPVKKEEVEQIDELKKSTLASYAKKATDDATYHSFSAGTRSSKDPERLKDDEKAMKRQSGVNKAVDRLAKEETGEKKMKTLNQFREGFKEMLADVKKRSEPQPNGGSGIKQGSRYGGGKQKSTPDQEAEKSEKKK